MRSVFKEDYLDTLFFEQNPSFSPDASWVTNNQQERPHIIFTMKHDVTGDERLLRGELLAIVAAMSSRMRFPKFDRHAVVPVSTKFFDTLTSSLPC